MCECITILVLTAAAGIIIATLEDRRAERHARESQRIARGGGIQQLELSLVSVIPNGRSRVLFAVERE